MQEYPRISVSQVTLAEAVGIVFYDLQSQRTIDDLTDYSLVLSERLQLDKKTVIGTCYDLKKFYEFLLKKGLLPRDATDKVLKVFRDEDKKSVMASPRSKKKARVANSTCNERLRRVYRWLHWLQDTERAGQRLIGARGCAVRSTLPDDIQPYHARLGGGRPYLSSVRSSLYPLLFRRTASRSRHNMKYVPSESNRFEVQKLFHEGAVHPYLAHRNSLIVDIAHAVGLRRGSINSLTVGQFLRGEVQASDFPYFRITPEAQKFGYENSFDVPIVIAGRISHFIEKYLVPIAKERKWKFNVESSRLFLSYRDGKPLEDRSITSIVSKALRALGVPSWNATHSFRRKFTNDEIRRESAFRVEEGLDTSTDSIAASVSRRLGQSNPNSLYSYVSSEVTAPHRNVQDDSKLQISQLETQVFELMEQNRKLKKLLRPTKH